MLLATSPHALVRRAAPPRAALPDEPTAVVLDEDPAVTLYVAYVLERLGFAVRRFLAGAEALPAVADDPPTVLVINSSLADMQKTGSPFCAPRAMRTC